MNTRTLQGSEILRRSLKYFGKHKGKFVLAVLAASVVGMVDPAMGRFLQFLIDNVFETRDLANLRLGIAIFLAIYAAKGLGLFISRYMMFWIGYETAYEMRRDMFSHLQRLSLDYFHRNRIGQIMSRFTNDVPVVQSLLLIMNHAVIDIMRVVLSLGYLFWLHWKLTLSIMTIIPCMALLVQYISNKLRRIGRLMQHSVGELNTVLQETLNGIREIKAFCTERKEEERFDAVNRENLWINMKCAKYNALNTPAIEITISWGIAIILWMGTRKIIAGELTPAQFMGYLAVLGTMFHPIRKLVDTNNIVRQSLAAFERIYALMDEEVEIREAPDALPVEDVRRDIRFESVWFTYPSKEEPILRGVDLEVPTGMIVALVGSSGSGKTTMVNLLPRFYDVSSGCITIDGVDIRRLKLGDLRSLFGIVPQETFLFSGTIRYNITYGVDGEIEEEKVLEAARDANALEFIEKLPDGLDTILGERGVQLSGGQRQRIAIARAILKNPKILILDEATSSLDTESERLVQEALERLMVSRTTFVIAHRLSTVKNADRIVVLERGRIVETGTHDSLYAKGGLYYRLCTTQALTGGNESAHDVSG